MPLTIVRNDITKLDVDAIVNAANTQLQMSGGVCGAIFNAAGADRLQDACDKLAPIQTGEAVITKGFALSAKYIIHTAGPVYSDGNNNEEALLRLCYINALKLAKKHGCKSIAFPLISSGIYGYPKDGALSVATNAIRVWLMENDIDVSLVVFDKAAFSLSQELLGEVKAFIDENYVDEHNLRYSHGRTRQLADLDMHEAADKSLALFSDEQLKTKKETLKADEAGKIFDTGLLPKMPKRQTPAITQPSAQIAPEISHKTKKLDDVVGQLDEPFSSTLLRLIDEKGKTDVEVYKRANLDRKLFSKIRTGKGYMPGKKTVVALAVALELSLKETSDLLERAGFALSRSVMFDVIIEYFITRKRYDIFEINNALFEYDQPLLGG